MYRQIFSFFVTILACSILLQSCHTQSLVSEKNLSESSASVKTNSSSIPIKENLIADYITDDRPEGLETASDPIVVGKPQASIEDSKPISISESQDLTRKLIFNESVVVKDTENNI